MKEKGIKIFLVIVCAAIIAMLCETFIFNYRFFASYGNNSIAPTYIVGNGLMENNGNTWNLNDLNEAYIEIPGIDKEVDYLFVDILCHDSGGDIIQTDMTLMATDEGNAIYYELGKIRTHPSAPKNNYIKLHTYGNLHSLKIQINTAEADTVQVQNVELCVSVPLMISLKRFFLILTIIAFSVYFPSRCFYLQMEIR